MNILDKCKEIKEKEQVIIDKIESLFAPLRKRYVSTTLKTKIVKKKFLGIFPYSKKLIDKEVVYLPLIINIRGYEYNCVTVEILHYIQPLVSPLLRTIDIFPLSLFELPDTDILNNDQMDKFMKQFLCNATPKWMKYECFVKHITDEEKKFFIADKLEELFESETFANLSRDVKDSEWISNYVYDFIKTMEMKG